MKVIFLDIDGVMNSEVFYVTRHNKQRIKTKFFSIVKFLFVHQSSQQIKKSHYKFRYLFKRLKEETDPSIWKILVSLVNENDYKICISSSWKYLFKNLNDWDKALTKLGFKRNTFIGITPSIEGIRGEEIKAFCNRHDNITSYVILDDDKDMLSEQLSSFIYVDRYTGLTPSNIANIKCLLEKQ